MMVAFIGSKGLMVLSIGDRKLKLTSMGSVLKPIIDQESLRTSIRYTIVSRGKVTMWEVRGRRFSWIWVSAPLGAKTR